MQRHFIPVSQPHVLFVLCLFYLDSIQTISVKKRNALLKNVAGLRLWQNRNIRLVVKEGHLHAEAL